MARQTKEQNLKNRLGSDLAFPINGSFESISGMDLLIQDIQILLLTVPGERPGRPDFGCQLTTQIWENLEEAKNDGIGSIIDALERFEPRVTVLGVTGEINNNTGLITFNIQFIVETVDNPINLVFPFRAGTQLSFS